MAETAAEVFFDDLAPGTVVDLGTTVVDREEMLAFSARFDPQPFHLDDAAGERVFGGLAASGWFTAALWMRAYVDGLLSRAAALGSPGGDEIAWPAPVFAGDELHARMEVLDARVSRSRPSMGLITLRGTMTRTGDGAVVYRSRFTGMFALRPVPPAP
ncbi:MaoC/PaaZ C-terminal domain-containing protein [Pseudonocardia sp. ICBG1293]|uniref:MaoC/PaaZ C-terminal domain-containing protein n=1 Tax=Pseudonocardia sp. ICBG1293 TaxID=2844382 RepID=UPI001CCFBC7B|nr:MaoC/PaaZ C-terminal domain-containing protein [Pseudonocardia sp. ICBG1293]